jgi:hypothetical protein
MYPAVRIHAVELENMYILILAGSFSSFISMQSKLTMIRPLPLSSGNYNLLVLLLVLSLGSRSPSRPLTSFSTTTGTCQWTCVSMGHLTASQEMQRFAEGVLQSFSSSTTFEYTDVLGTTKRAPGTVVVYIDDTCVVSFGTRQEHEILLLRVLKRMHVHNLKIQSAKCDFLRHEVSFLGHVLRGDGILTEDSKISSIKNWSSLTDIRSVRVFVSLCSYYRKYIWRYAEIATPLTNLLKDGGWCPPTDPDILTVVD